MDRTHLISGWRATVGGGWVAVLRAWVLYCLYFRLGSNQTRFSSTESGFFDCFRPKMKSAQLRFPRERSLVWSGDKKLAFSLSFRLSPFNGNTIRAEVGKFGLRFSPPENLDWANQILVSGRPELVDRIPWMEVFRIRFEQFCHRNSDFNLGRWLNMTSGCL